MNRNRILTDREKQVLCLLLENKVMTRKQIVAEVFPALDKGNVTHRLNRILTEGLVRDYMDRRFSKTDILYELTDDGLRLTKSIYSMEFDQSPARTYAITHDVGLVTLRNLFQKKSMVKEYIPENVLQCAPFVREDQQIKPFAEMMSDAVLKIKFPNFLKFAALEFEPTSKNLDRYRDKILNYYVKSRISLVLYVCDHEKTIEKIKSIESEIKPDGATKMYFALFENVLSSSDKLTFFGRNQAKIEIN